MRIADFTHIIEPSMPVYPGTEPPHLKAANTYERDGFRETLLELYSHTGTHMDAPAHIFPDRPTLDQLPAEQFVGRALVVDCSDAKAGEILGMDRLEAVREADAIAQVIGRAADGRHLEGHIVDRQQRLQYRPASRRRVPATALQKRIRAEVVGQTVIRRDIDIPGFPAWIWNCRRPCISMSRRMMV